MHPNKTYKVLFEIAKGLASQNNENEVDIVNFVNSFKYVNFSNNAKVKLSKMFDEEILGDELNKPSVEMEILRLIELGKNNKNIKFTNVMLEFEEDLNKTFGSKYIINTR